MRLSGLVDTGTGARSCRNKTTHVISASVRSRTAAPRRTFR
ncbi:hypothetical protein BDFB_012881 [Asbolus verrucosus]|uniref:Uncharacterized protein n=1 Tax=Asbolus verrucosus TaxID=1661398 RepID=A0A482V976_ASBVE|nr:hypothetical protein BDFB_012881 [Asbolus verrucosus]